MDRETGARGSGGVGQVRTGRSRSRARTSGSRLRPGGSRRIRWRAWRMSRLSLGQASVLEPAAVAGHQSRLPRAGPFRIGSRGVGAGAGTVVRSASIVP